MIRVSVVLRHASMLSILLCATTKAGVGQGASATSAGQNGSAVPASMRQAAASSTIGQVIAGRVVSAADGHPIPNATITLNGQQREVRRQAPRATQGQTTQTDAEGRYRLPAQAAGRYSLQASAPGYLPSLYLEHSGYSSAVVTGAGVSTEDLRFSLVREATLHGRVLDDTGEPVRATIALYRDTKDDPDAANPAPFPVPGSFMEANRGAAQRMRPAGGAQADEDGRFDFPSLQPGRYFVAATAIPWYAVYARSQGNEDRLPYRTAIDPALDVAYPITFYPHATDEAGALPIVLKPGQRATANLLMQAEHAVTLTVQMPPASTVPGGRPEAFPTLLRKVFGTNQGAGAQVTGRVGDTLLISGMAPGQYVMRVFGRQGTPSADETPVNLSTGSATVAMHSPEAATSADLAVSLHLPGGAAVPEGAQIELQRFGPSREPAQRTATVEQGVAHFHSLEAGQYRVRMRSGDQTWTVSRLTVNDRVVPSRLLRVDGSSIKVDVLASHYAPELNGMVQAADGRAHAGSLVVLVPAGTDSGEDLYRADQSDLDGGFQFAGVLPGNYLLVAIDNDWKLNWRDATALMPYLSHAIPITVAESGARAITLPEAAIVQQK